MDKSDSPQQHSNKSNQYQFLYGDPHRKFTVQLTVSQANAINQIIPKRHLLVLEREVKAKRNSKKKNQQSKKQNAANLFQFQEPSQRTKKIPNRYSEQIVQLNNYSRASSQAYDDAIDDNMKPCLKIINLLKGHRSSWPFKAPVDPVALNIPNYFQIIKEPMDLQTAQQNIRSRVYLTPTQFHADISKIIKNSYEFNKDNPDFVKLTNQFERFYIKISSQSSRNLSAPMNINTQMRKKSKQAPRIADLSRQSNDLNPVTLQEKRELALEIRKLPKQYLLEVSQLVYKDRAPTSEELNLQALPGDKIRELQKLVREKLAYMRVSTQNVRKEERENNNQENSEQSSFDSDSDS